MRAALQPFLAPGETLQWARTIRAASGVLQSGEVRLEGRVADLCVGVTRHRVLAATPRRWRRPKAPAFSVARDDLDLELSRIQATIDASRPEHVIGLVVRSGRRVMDAEDAWVLLLEDERDGPITAHAVAELIELLRSGSDGSIARRMFNESWGMGYESLGSLEAARAHPHGAVVLEGDHGGQIYLTCPAAVVACSEHTLAQLLRELDRIAWPTNRNEGMAIHFEIAPVGSDIAGGMGGGIVEPDVWIHPEFHELGGADEIREVIHGLRPSFEGPEQPVLRTDGTYVAVDACGWRLRFGADARVERETGATGRWTRESESILTLRFPDCSVPALFVGATLLVAPRGDHEDPLSAEYVDFEFVPDSATELD